MEIKSSVIVSVVMAALFVSTFAAHIRTSAYSTQPYLEVDSTEQASSEAVHPVNAASSYRNSEEDSIHGDDEGEKKSANVYSGIEYPTYKEVESVTTSYPAHVYEDSGYSTVSYSTVAYSAPNYNEPPYADAAYSSPDYSAPAYAAPTLDVPIYRSPAVLPYWMQSEYVDNSIGNNAPAY